MTQETADFNSLKYSTPQPHKDSGLVRINLALRLLGQGKRVLDLGCWDGSIAKQIQAQDNQVFGMENSRPAAELARQKGITVFEGDIQAGWPDFGVKFDAVYAGEIIEHVFDTDGFLQKIRSVLADGGSVVLTTPNIAALGRRLMLLLGINPLTEFTAREHDAGHIRYFTRADLKKLLEENGFQVRAMLSDVVNFNGLGTMYSTALPKLCPGLGRSIVVLAQKLPDPKK